ncbi:hypothetical protein [Myceligenerans crystallogenes]|uniref:NAD dependent epimerase/dehydratase family protein n=1 Tax=Myceligenerans crystallogenes TaxID=316335 RepID=A0ABN2NJF5_9MICO
MTPLVWGEGMTTPAKAVEAAAAGRLAWIDGGRRVIDLVHVGNLVKAVVAGLSHGRDRGVYYVTDGSPLPIREFFTPVLEIAGADVSGARSVPGGVATVMAGVLEGMWRLLRRPTAPPLDLWLVAFLGRDRSYDIGRARAELGYRPRVTVAEGLAEMRDQPPVVSP